MLCNSEEGALKLAVICKEFQEKLRLQEETYGEIG